MESASQKRAHFTEMRSASWRHFGDLLATFSEHRFIYAPRMPADPFARSAVSSQRSLLAAQFSRSAVSIILSKPGRAPGVGPLGTQRRCPMEAWGPLLRTEGPLRGPWAHGDRWDDFGAIPSGVSP